MRDFFDRIYEATQYLLEQPYDGYVTAWENKLHFRADGDWDDFYTQIAEVTYFHAVKDGWEVEDARDADVFDWVEDFWNDYLRMNSGY